MRTRRQLLATGLMLAAGGLPRASAQSPDTLFAAIRAQAAALAREAWRAPPEAGRRDLLALGYDQYRQVQPLPGTMLWEDSAAMFRIAFFPAGYNHRHPVDVSIIDGAAATPLDVRPGQFRWPPDIVPGTAPLEVAGFRVLFPLHRPDAFDEVGVFLDASYFRLIAREQTYGASARGLAIDTGLPRPEEFPAFRRFWLVRPAPGDTALRLYALLDSPAVAGAYAFTVRPGAVTALDVEAQLFARHGIAQLGVAPLTSMFLSGENTAPAPGDFRPEVHDSDGLLLHAQGEWIWRPLTNPIANPATLRVTRLRADALAGFGLLQRDRSFASYLDREALYHRRPSYWITPLQPFGAGEVRLVEIPTRSEYQDNIVAFWTPDRPVQAGQQIDLRYRVEAFSGEARDSPDARPGAHAVATRIASPHAPGAGGATSNRRVIVDFAGSAIARLDPRQPVSATAEARGGRILARSIDKLPDDGWRLALDIAPDGDAPVELRAALTLYGAALSETWTYALEP